MRKDENKKLRRRAYLMSQVKTKLNYNVLSEKNNRDWYIELTAAIVKQALADYKNTSKSKTAKALRKDAYYFLTSDGLEAYCGDTATMIRKMAGIEKK